MKKPLVVFAGALATLSLVGPAFAQTYPSNTAPSNTTSTTRDTTSTAPAPAEKPSKLALPHRVTGELVSVDPNAGTFMVKSTKGKEMMFTAEGSAASRLADLKTGERVKVSYKNSHGHMIASKVVPAEVAATR